WKPTRAWTSTGTRLSGSPARQCTAGNASAAATKGRGPGRPQNPWSSTAPHRAATNFRTADPDRPWPVPSPGGGFSALSRAKGGDNDDFRRRDVPRSSVSGADGYGERARGPSVTGR